MSTVLTGFLIVTICVAANFVYRSIRKKEKQSEYDLRELNSSTKDELNNAKHEVELLKKEVVISNNNLNTLQSRHDELVGKHNLLTEEHSDLKKEHQAVKTRFEQIEKEKIKLESENRMHVVMVSDLNTKINDKEVEFKALHKRTIDIINNLQSSSSNEESNKKALEFIGNGIKDIYNRVFTQHNELSSQQKSYNEQSINILNRLNDALLNSIQAVGSAGEILLINIVKGFGLEQDRDFFCRKKLPNGRFPDVLIDLSRYKYIFEVKNSQNIDDCDTLTISYIKEIANKKYQEMDNIFPFIFLYFPNQRFYDTLITKQSWSKIAAMSVKHRIILTHPNNVISTVQLLIVYSRLLLQKEFSFSNSKDFLMVKKFIEMMNDYIRDVEDLGQSLENLNKKMIDISVKRQKKIAPQLTRLSKEVNNDIVPFKPNPLSSV